MSKSRFSEIGALLEHRIVQDAAALLFGLLVTVPLWVGSRPPIQDFPQHVAAVRVLSSYSDHAFRFAEYFELSLGRTQYLSVYALAALLARAVGPAVATKVVLTLALAATPYCLMRLLRRLHVDPWLGLLALPLLFNVHVGYGFLNFVAGIPLLFLGIELSLTAALRANSAQGAAVTRPLARLGRTALPDPALAALLVLSFYTHVIPFGLLVIAILVLTAWQRSVMVRLGRDLWPSLGVALYWLVTSPSGQVLTGVATATGVASAPSYQSAGAALRALPSWMLTIGTGDEDELRLVVWWLTVLLLAVLATCTPVTSRDAVEGAPRCGRDGPTQCSESSIATSWSDKRGLLAVTLLVPLSMLAYFTLPAANGFIWPICQRFPILAAFCSIPMVRGAPRWARRTGALVSVITSLTASAQLSALYRDVEARAYAGFDAVTGEIPRGSRVAALIFERNVEGLRASPLMHAAGWVQAERGGLVMFTFAEFPPSPFTYRESRRPPQVSPRWEWLPDRVNPDRELGYYEYVLVHGWAGSLRSSQGFKEMSTRGRWSLWKRLPAAESRAR